MQQKKREKAKRTEKKILSVVAIIETILVVLLVWWLAFILESYWFVLMATCITPLLLMYSPKSVRFGKKWLRTIITKPVDPAPEQWRAVQWLIFLLLLSLASFVIFTVSYRLSGYFITGSESYALLIWGFVFGLAGPSLVLIIVFVFIMALLIQLDATVLEVAAQMAMTFGIAGAIGGVAGLWFGGQAIPVILAGIFGAGVGILLPAVMSGIERLDKGDSFVLIFFVLALIVGIGAGAIAMDVMIEGKLPYEVMILATVLIVVVSSLSLIRHNFLRTLFFFPFIPGYVTGCLVLAVFVHGAAILCSLPEGFRSIISNFRSVVLHTYSPKPMVVGGLLSVHNIITPLGKESLFQGKVVIIFLNFIRIIGSYAYHILIKSTAWFWWPLIWIGSGKKG